MKELKEANKQLSECDPIKVNQKMNHPTHYSFLLVWTLCFHPPSCYKGKSRVLIRVTYTIERDRQNIKERDYI